MSEPSYDELRRRLAEAEAREAHLRELLRGLQRASQPMVQEDDPQRLAERLCERLVEALGVRRAWIGLLDDGQTLRATASAGCGEAFASLGQQLAGGELPRCLREAGASDSVVVIHNPQAECPDCPLACDGQAALARALRHGDRLYGLLSVAVPATAAGDEDHLALLELVAGELTLVLRQRQASAADAAARERYLHTILQTTADGFWVLDRQGRVLEANAAYCAMTGYSPEAIRGLGIGDLDADEDQAATAARIQRIITNGHEVFEARHRRRDGSVFPVEVSTTYVDVDGGRFVCFARDLTERQEREERIALLGRMLDAAPAAITVHDQAGRFLYANRATYALHGYDDETEFLGVSLQKLDVPASAQLAEERYQRFEQAGEARFEVAHYRRDGSIVPLEVLAKAIDWAGRPAILSIATDITERRQAETALTASEERFRTLYENLPAGSCIDEVLYADGQATDHRILDVNPAYERIMGIRREAAVNALGSQLYGAGPSPFLPILARVAETGETAHFESFFEPIGRHLEYSVSRQRPGVVSTIFTDITERKRAEAELRDAAVKLQEAVRAANVGLWDWDLTTNVVSYSPEWKAQLGYAPEEIGDSFEEWRQRVHPDDLASALGRVQRAIAEREPDYQLEFRLRHRDGSYRWILAQGSVLLNEQGDAVRAVGSHVDLTVRKQAEEVLRASEERFRLLAELAPIGILISDRAERTLYVSPTFVELFGYDLAAMPSVESWWPLAYPDPTLREQVRALWQQHLTAAREHGGPVPPIEFPVTCRDGTVRQTEFRLATSGDVNVVVLTDVTERRQADGALRHSHELMRYVIEHTHSAVAVHDRDLRYIYVSQRYLDDYGITGQNIIGQHHYDVFPDLPQKWRDVHQRVLAGEVCTADRDSWPGASGAADWTRWQCRPWYEADGTIGGLVLYTEVITEQVRAEQALAQSEARLRALIEASPLAIISLDLDGCVQTWNAAAERVFGWSADEVLGGPLPIVPVEQLTESLRFRAQVERGEALYQVELTRQRRDGSAVDVSLSTAPVRDQEGRVTALVGSFEDITERKRAAEELRRRENQLQRIFEILPIGLWFADGDGTLLRGNPKGVEIWGAEPQVPISEYGIFKAWRLPAREPLGADDWALAKTIRDGVTIVDELLEIEAFDGTHKTILNYSAPILDEAGRVDGAIVVNLDISERMDLEEQLRQAQKMESVGRLAGGVAHDFNNMLNVILGHANLVLEDLPPDSSWRDDLEEIWKAAQRSADLTRQLLAFARQQTVAPKLIDLNATVEGMLRMLRRLIGEDLELVWRPGADVGRVFVDPSQIDQILANLCVNARDAIADTGQVTIATGTAILAATDCAEHPDCTPGEYVLLSVSDTGCGMDAATAARVFDPFFTTKHVGQGTGLGLATVYGIARQNDGFIQVDTAPNQGTTLTVYLPRRLAAVEESAVAATSVPPAPGRETILLVEDEPAILRLTTRQLRRLGYTVLTAATPAEAIRLAREHEGEIHLLMTDVIMPEMNGRDLAEHLLSLNPRLKRLYMSGYTADVIAPHGVLDEGVHFIQKPFSAEQLAQVTSDILRQE